MTPASNAPQLIAPAAVVDEAWHRLSRAADDPADQLRIITLCTVTPENRPAGRLMLLRGAHRASGRLWCHSRRESGKVVDLRTNPNFAAVAYDAGASIQMRISGTATVLSGTAASDHFDQLIGAKQSAGNVPAMLPDPVWPGAAELLIRASTRESSKHLAVIEMQVEAIVWTQVIRDKLVGVVVRADNQWLPERIT